jgi:hypothetical protein
MLRSSTGATDPRPCFLADGERRAQWPHGGPTGAPALANPGALLHIPAGGCGCSSGVEHHVANVRVEGSNPFARSNLSVVAGGPAARICARLGRCRPALAPRRSQHCHPSCTGDIGDPLGSRTSVLGDSGDACRTALPSAAPVPRSKHTLLPQAGPLGVPGGGLRRRGGRGVLSHKGPCRPGRASGPQALWGRRAPRKGAEEPGRPKPVVVRRNPLKGLTFLDGNPHAPCLCQRAKPAGTACRGDARPPPAARPGRPASPLRHYRLTLAGQRRECRYWHRRPPPLIFRYGRRPIRRRPAVAAQSSPFSGKRLHHVRTPTRAA